MQFYYSLLTVIVLAVCSNVNESQGMDFSLKANQKSIEVRTFMHYHYASFDIAGTTELILKCDSPVQSCEISPLSRAIKSSIKNNQISFKLDKPGYVMVRINETEKFFVFAEETEIIPGDHVINIHSYGIDKTGQKIQTELIQRAMDDAAESGKTLLFPEGIYTAGQLRPKSNTHIHLVRGALLQSDVSSVDQYLSDDKVKTRKFIYIKDAKNVKITGYGTISGNGTQLREKFGDNARMRLIMAVNSQNLTIDGVMLQDPGSWNTQILSCQDVLIRHVKLMNNIDLSNTDGFDPDASKRLLIIDCFAYCSDDNVAIKTTNYGDYLDDVEDITVTGNVFLTKKSSLKVGTETRGKNMRNILFENNDVLESDRGMALYVSDGAKLENIRFINNRFERNYPDAKRAGLYFQVNIRNENSKMGQIKNILVKDCVFYTAFPKPSQITGLNRTHGIENITIDNLVIEGEKVSSLQDARIEINGFVRNLIFK
jgi:hypothetical protein